MKNVVQIAVGAFFVPEYSDERVVISYYPGLTSQAPVANEESDYSRELLDRLLKNEEGDQRSSIHARIESKILTS